LEEKALNILFGEQECGFFAHRNNMIFNNTQAETLIWQHRRPSNRVSSCLAGFCSLAKPPVGE
jgi:hypothetical protein